MIPRIPEEFLSHLQGARNLLLSGHVNPDGDSVGSGVGLARILKSLGKSATIWNRDATPSVCLGLPGTDRIHTGSEPPDGFPEAYDLVVALECPTLDRTGLADQLGTLPVINVDHHLGNTEYGVATWIDTEAPALGEMIFFLGQAMGAPIDRDTANALLLALVSDTGGFRFANATERAFTAARLLVQHGAEPDTVSHWLYESRPLASVSLLREMLGTLELSADGSIATALLTHRAFERAGATPADTEGLIDHPRSIAGVRLVALVRQLAPHRCKVSLRSRGPLNVEKVAAANGGGGHPNAAGFTIEASPEEAREFVVDRLKALLAGKDL